VDTVQPQIPCPFSILRSILTSVPIGFGLGPKVMLEVLVVPDWTALITAFETLAASAIDEIFKAPDAETKDNNISPLNAMKMNFFLTVISLTFLQIEIKMLNFQVSLNELTAHAGLYLAKKEYAAMVIFVLGK
jgi:hypothetical protein